MTTPRTPIATATAPGISAKVQGPKESNGRLAVLARVPGGACTITVAYPFTPAAEADTSSANVPMIVPALNKPASVMLALGTDVVQENETP